MPHDHARHSRLMCPLHTHHQRLLIPTACSALTRLEVTCCQMGQAGLDALSAALPHLAHAELRLLDAVSAGALQARLGAAGGGLTAHASRAKANTLVGAAGQSMAGVAELAVRHTCCGFVLTAAPTFHLLAAQLTSLNLPRIQLPPVAAVQLAACTALRELEVELAFTVRDGDLLTWMALRDMRCLRLAGNFYLSEEAIAAVLAAMPHLRLLRLETVQGGGGMLAPLAELRCVRVLELSGCHLNCAASLRAALCSASGLTHLRVHVSAGLGGRRTGVLRRGRGRGVPWSSCCSPTTTHLLLSLPCPFPPSFPVLRHPVGRVLRPGGRPGGAARHAGAGAGLAARARPLHRQAAQCSRGGAETRGCARCPARSQANHSVCAPIPLHAAAEALALACSGCTQLTALDIHVVGYARDAPAVPAWGRLAALTGLRRLHASTGVGWDCEGFAAVAAAATGLRELALTDNAAQVVTPDWAAALAPQQQLTLLQLNSCTALGPEAASLLGQPRSLTGLQIFRWGGMGEPCLHAAHHFQSCCCLLGRSASPHLLTLWASPLQVPPPGLRGGAAPAASRAAGPRDADDAGVSEAQQEQTSDACMVCVVFCCML